MMRPMKIAGSQLMFGQGCLEHLKTLKGSRAMIVMGGSSLEKNGILGKITGYLDEVGISHEVFRGVEPDPSFATVWKGAEAMKAYQPDIIIALGGGSPMDAAKAMWVFYEHPELTKLADILPPNPIPKLREKAYMVCIPSTSGTASEVSRSVVITDEKTKLKHGIGNMEMMPDIAICDPEVTASMPPKITAETGLDALTHAVEAYLSNRANYVSDVFAVQAVKDIFAYLPKAYEEGSNLQYREQMLNASLIAGMAFTNVSLGIVHSMAHTIGSFFGVAHGLADAIILPYVIDFNSANEVALDRYRELAKELGASDFSAAVKELNEKLNIPHSFSSIIEDEAKYNAVLKQMAEMALADGCTKTNPIIPTVDELIALFTKVYKG
jgi:alcohol dehydrogenase class IV